MTRPFRRADSRPLFSGSFAGALEPRRLLSAESFDSIAAPADALLGPAVEFGASAYFFTRDSGVPIARAELWKSDGTPAGTVPTGVSFSVPTPDDVPASLTVMGGRLLFAATDERLGRELWVSDGTPEGTAPASDFAAPSARPGAMIVVGQQAFFALDDAATGRELWRTDGTPGGTRLVADIRPDGSSNPTLLTPFAGRLFFVADDGTHGAETWSTDGTPGGTSLLADVRPAAASAQVTTMYAGRTTKGDFLFFDADAGGTPGTGPEPWVSDGTEIGTRPLRDVLPGSKGSRPTSFAAFNGYVYFSADDGVSGRELWRTDGSAVGTARVADARPGGLSTDPKELTPLRDRLLFAATGQSGGLWSTDGTALGTRQIMPPAPDAFITLRDMRAVGDRVFFVAATQRGGEEPWVDVSVRADQGQLARFVVDLPGDSTDGGIGIEEPIRVEGQPRKRWGHPRDNIL